MAADWSVWPREPGGQRLAELPVVEAEARVLWNDVGAYTFAVPFTPTRWQACGAGRRIEMRRNGRRLIVGPIVERELTVDGDHPGGLITVVGESDESLLADRITYPAPSAAGTAQTTASHWTMTGRAESVMLALVSSNAGPLARSERRVPDLIIGPDRATGGIVKPLLRYDNLLTALQVIAGGAQPLATPVQNFPPVDYGTVSDAQWNALLAAGWIGRPDDGAERLYHPQAPASPPPVTWGSIPEADWNARLAAGWYGRANDGAERLYPPPALMTYVIPARGGIVSTAPAGQERLTFRIEQTDAGRQFIVEPARDLSATVRYSLGLGNLTGLTFRETAPTTTYALVAGQGELTARLQRDFVTTDAATLAYGRRIEQYVDRRDTADTAELDKAGAEAIAAGRPARSLPLSPVADHGIDPVQLVGSLVTVQVGPVGYTATATVVDLVREVRAQLTADGEDVVTPVIGSDNAAGDALGALLNLDGLDRRLANLERA